MDPAADIKNRKPAEINKTLPFNKLADASYGEQPDWLQAFTFVATNYITPEVDGRPNIIHGNVTNGVHLKVEFTKPTIKVGDVEYTMPKSPGTIFIPLKNK